MTLKIAIVEDSQENVEILQYMLEKCPVQAEVIGIAKTTNEANLLLTRPDIDLALLDIQLKEGTIFDVLGSLQGKGSIKFEIIFVTAHGSYENALKAIQFACLDFINKPVDQEELNHAIQKANVKKPEQNDQQIKLLLDLIKNESQIPNTIGIILPKGVIEFVTISDILFFTADQNICRIQMLDGRKMVSSRHLGYYIELLSSNPDFTQSSKSHLINLNQIKQYDHRERTIRFPNNEYVIASFRFSKDIRKQLLDRQSKGGFFRDGLDRLSNLFK